MQRQSSRRYTVDEYFSVEESSEIKHEFYQGEIFAMVGASLNHNRITGNIFAALRTALRNTSCEAFTHDLRLRTPSGLYTYPDVMVICGPVTLTNDRLETVMNPTVLMEVLWDSTRDYDQGEKLILYRSIRTLQDYVLIEQSTVKVDHWRLIQKDEWTLEQHLSLQDQLKLSSLNFLMPLSEIYNRVEFVK